MDRLIKFFEQRNITLDFNSQLNSIFLIDDKYILCQIDIVNLCIYLSQEHFLSYVDISDIHETLIILHEKFFYRDGLNDFDIFRSEFGDEYNDILRNKTGVRKFETNNIKWCDDYSKHLIIFLKDASPVYSINLSSKSLLLSETEYITMVDDTRWLFGDSIKFCHNKHYDEYFDSLK